MTAISKIVFDKTEWKNQVSRFHTIEEIELRQTDPTNSLSVSQQLLNADPRLAYYVYRSRNTESDGYYRRRLEQFLSDSDSDDEGTPNKQLFKIEKEFISDMKRRFCEAEGICWVYVKIGCNKPSCQKKHQLFDPTRKQIIEYFDIFVPKMKK